MVKAEFSVWVSGEPASVAGSIARALELELAGSGATVVLATERLSAAALAGGAVVEVVVGDPLSGAGPSGAGRSGAGPSGAGPSADRSSGDASGAPAIVVPGDGARAGESARTVLRHLAAAGWSDPLDEYSDDDEAAVAGRLQAFGYL